MRDSLPHKVTLVAYDAGWPLLAELESARLKPALGRNLLAMEHFGSTAVPGMTAKPVIDQICIVASLDDLDWSRPKIEALGYEWHGDFGIDGRRFCTLTRDGRRLFHFHAYQQGSGHIPRHLAVRDYLRAHPAIARDYEAEKHRAAAMHPDDSIAYSLEKGAWVSRLEAEAKAWAGIERSSLA